MLQLAFIFEKLRFLPCITYDFFLNELDLQQKKSKSIKKSEL